MMQETPEVSSEFTMVQGNVFAFAKYAQAFERQFAKDK